MQNQIHTITKTERDAIVAREQVLHAWMKEHKTNSYRTEQVAHLNPPSNDERTQVELFDFVNDPPSKYFLYVNEEKQLATTWTGVELGKISFGREYRDNFGGKRVSLRMRGINGKAYFGAYYKSSGDYARITACK